MNFFYNLPPASNGFDDFFHWHILRQKLLSKPLFNLFRAAIPTISKTEKEALDAGTVGWDRDLFSGKPNWKQFFSKPLSQLNLREKEFIDGPVQQLCEQLDDWKITHKLKDLPQPLWDFIKIQGFFGLIIPKAYHGLEFSAQAHSEIVMKIASKSISAAVTIMVPNSLGPAKLLLEYGTEEQKNYYLPRLARGKEIPAFALTSPSSGSDAASISDQGTICYGDFEGKHIIGIRLNWNKRYITLGPICTLLGLAFKLYDPNHLVFKHTEIGITLALIPTKTPGISIGRRHYPLHQVFQNGPNSGKNVFIPLDWIIGGKINAGKGWSMLMQCLVDGRAISLPALSTGGCKFVSRTVGAYARIRTQFNQSIANFGGVSEKLSEIAAYTYLVDASRCLTLSALDAGEKPAIISAIVKYQLTEKMRLVVNHGMDIYAGAAICMGPKNHLAALYKAIPISITVEGANILTRSLITYGQGVMRSHPYIFKEISALNCADKQQGLGIFDKTISAHINSFISNLFKTFWLAISNGHFSATAPGVKNNVLCKHYVQQLNRYSSSFAFISDVCLVVYGSRLKTMEKISGRFADILSQMYLLSAVLKRYQADNFPPSDAVLVDWCCQQLFYEMQQSFQGILANLSHPWLARVLYLFIFPLGRPYKLPSDQLADQVADRITTPSNCRDRLTAGIYLSNDTSTHTGQLDDALNKTILAQPDEKKLRKLIKELKIKGQTTKQYIEDAKSKNFIDDNSYKILLDVIQAKEAVIQVDDFSKKLK
ncbi:MAG: acyl-CoA dehydrogenase [Pseudomonadota bacterium]